MRYFLDTEFNEFGGELISLALVGEVEGGRELYLSTPCANPGAWVAENVIPIIKCAGADPIEIEPSQFGRVLSIFLSEDNVPEIIADWPDDISYFCKALITAPGEMVSIPYLQFHMVRVDAYPTELEGAVQHNALWDARALRRAFFSALFADFSARRADKRMSEWKPIETAPKDGNPILVCYWDEETQDRMLCTSAFWSRLSDRWWSEIADRGVRPTHWMPLPKPPALSQG